MKISFEKYPIDIIICIFWSLILLPVVLLNITDNLRVVLGLPFILFIPGYILIFALFPTKKIDKAKINKLRKFCEQKNIVIRQFELIFSEIS